jgi:hypothetical protein
LSKLRNEKVVRCREDESEEEERREGALNGRQDYS